MKYQILTKEGAIINTGLNSGDLKKFINTHQKPGSYIIRAQFDDEVLIATVEKTTEAHIVVTEYFSKKNPHYSKFAPLHLPNANIEHKPVASLPYSWLSTLSQIQGPTPTFIEPDTSGKITALPGCFLDADGNELIAPRILADGSNIRSIMNLETRRPVGIAETWRDAKGVPFVPNHPLEHLKDIYMEQWLAYQSDVKPDPDKYQQWFAEFLDNLPDDLLNQLDFESIATLKDGQFSVPDSTFYITENTLRTQTMGICLPDDAEHNVYGFKPVNRAFTEAFQELAMIPQRYYALTNATVPAATGAYSLAATPVAMSSSSSTRSPAAMSSSSSTTYPAAMSSSRPTATVFMSEHELPGTHNVPPHFVRWVDDWTTSKPKASSSSLFGIPDYDYVRRVVLVGEHAAGKTCLLARFALNQYTDKFISTIGDFDGRTLDQAGQRVKLHVLDPIYSPYGKSPGRINAAIVCADLSDEASVDAAEKWLIEEREYMPNVVLVGTKADRINSPCQAAVQNNQNRMNDLAEQYNCPVVFSSAKESRNVDLAFRIAIAQMQEPTLELEDELVQEPPIPMPDSSTHSSSKRSFFGNFCATLFGKKAEKPSAQDSEPSRDLNKTNRG